MCIKLVIMRSNSWQTRWPDKNTVRVISYSNRTFRISRQSSIDKFFVAIGYSKKIKTFNEQFDSEFYIESDDEDFADFLRKNSEVQKLIMELMSLNIKTIELSQHSLSAIFKKGYYKNGQYNLVEYNEQITTLLEKIRDAIKELPNIRVSKFWEIWKVTLSLLFLFSCIASMYLYKDMDKIAVSGLFWEAVKYSIPFYILLLAPALIKSFRTSYAHLVLLLNLFALLVIPFAVYTMLVYVNIHHDDDIKGKEYCMYVDFKNNRVTNDYDDYVFNYLLDLNYSVEFKSCDQNNFSFELYTDKSLWQELHYGDRVKAIIHKGKLGYPWGSGIITIPKEPSTNN